MKIRMVILTFVRLLVEYPLVVGGQWPKDLHVSEFWAACLIELNFGGLELHST